MTDVDPQISEYFSNLAKRRTDNHRGFNDPEVQAKIQKLRKAKRDAKS